MYSLEASFRLIALMPGFVSCLQHQSLSSKPQARKRDLCGV